MFDHDGTDLHSDLENQATTSEESPMIQNRDNKKQKSNEVTDENHTTTDNDAPLAARPDWYVAANNVFEHTLKLNINPVSFVGRKNHNPYSNIPKCADETVDLEVECDTSLYCLQCKQLNNYCHRKVYKDYIKTKLFANYANQLVKPKYDEIKEAMKEAYNERRCVMVHEEFKFYDREDIDMPDCLVGYSFELATLIKDVVKAAKINHETRLGVCKYVAAKRMRMC